MAVLQRHKSTIFGLVADLNAITSAADAEVTRATDAETQLGTDLAAEVTRATDAETQLGTDLALTNTNLADEITRALAAEAAIFADVESTYLNKLSALPQNINSAQVTFENDVKINGDIIQNGGVKTVIGEEVLFEDNIVVLNSNADVNAAPIENAGWAVNRGTEGIQEVVIWDESIDKLTALKNADDKDNLVYDNIAFSGDVTAITDQLSTDLAAEVTRATAAEVTLTNGLADLSGVSDNETARTNLDVYSKAEVDSNVSSGGAVFITESLLVTADTIQITHAAKADMLFNFNTARHTDSNFVSYDIPARATAPGSTTYNLSPNAAGDFDGKMVSVQYAYSPA